MLKALFSRQWWWTTLLVLAAMAVMVRLGFWQLDRLAQRRAFNARVGAQLAQPPLELTGEALQADPSPFASLRVFELRSGQGLAAMEYRTVTVAGDYDHAQEVAVRNQAWEDPSGVVRDGVHLLTPLVIAGSAEAVLVDRGWIPLEESAPENWGAHNEPGTVTVKGVIRLSRSRPDFGGVADPEGQLTFWNNVNIDRISQQVSHPLLLIYIQQAPDPAWTSLPYRSQPELDLTEGPHFGYALQWFAFAAVLGLGYPRFVRQSLARAASPPLKQANAGSR